jgi:hypothetical protein
MKMKTTMIAALAAAQLSVVASPAQAAELPGQEAATRQARFDRDAELILEDGQSPSASRATAAAAEDDAPRKKKRRSTGDKVLTGAAVILGVGAVAVGALLVALVAN